MSAEQTVEIKGISLVEDAATGVRVIVQLANGVCKELFANKSDNCGSNFHMLPAGILLAPEYNG